MRNLNLKTVLTAGTLSLLMTQSLSASPFELDEEQKRMTVGADFRYRIIHEHDRKISDQDANGERTWQRFRLRVKGSLQVTRSAEINARFVTEPRYYSYPDLPSDQYKSWVRDEFLFDNLNLTLRDPLDIPVTAVIGRQQIQLADNWLVGEGTPLDGTRTAYFDAIRTTWNIEDWRTSVDVMYIDNRKDSSSVITPINDYDFDMIEQDERGGIVWLSHEAVERNFIDTYFIYKHDSNPFYKNDGTKVGVDGETYTFGLRGHGNATDHLSYNAEIAPQFGHKNGSSIEAFAVNTWAEQRISEKKNGSIRLGYEYLSGDSNIDKHFDKLWGREGIWSDLYTGGVDGFDGRVLDSSNLHRPHILAAVNLLDSVRAKGEYSLLFADKKVDLADASKVDNGSMFRGHHVKASLEHTINKHLKHYVTAQCMVPGDYYSDARQDTATWFRYGVETQW